MEDQYAFEREDAPANGTGTDNDAPKVKANKT